MSYILDSLKKSEQKRRQQEQPGLHSEPLGAAARRPELRRVWPLVLIVVLLLNAGLLGWYLWTVNQASTSSPAVTGEPAPATPAATRLPAEPAVSLPVQAAPAPPVPSNVPATPPSETQSTIVNHPPTTSETTLRESPVETIEPSATAAPLPLHQLSSAIRQQLPDMVLSLHYYSGQGQTGMIRLDGVILRVGDQVREGLTVQEIAAEGVVLDYRGQLLWLDRPRG